MASSLMKIRLVFLFLALALLTLKGSNGHPLAKKDVAVEDYQFKEIQKRGANAYGHGYDPSEHFESDYISFPGPSLYSNYNQDWSVYGDAHKDDTHPTYITSATDTGPHLKSYGYSVTTNHPGPHHHHHHSYYPHYNYEHSHHHYPAFPPFYPFYGNEGKPVVISDISKTTTTTTKKPLSTGLHTNVLNINTKGSMEPGSPPAKGSTLNTNIFKAGEDQEANVLKLDNGGVIESTG